MMVVTAVGADDGEGVGDFVVVNAATSLPDSSIAAPSTVYVVPSTSKGVCWQFGPIELPTIAVVD